MRNYIATVWCVSAIGDAVHGDKAIVRRIIRTQAEDEEDFKAKVMDGYHTEYKVWFGPISLSKEQ